jgi:aminopeptidase-like protein
VDFPWGYIAPSIAGILVTMNKSSGTQMYQWASDLFPLNRSLTGDGVRETLNYIKNELPELEIFEVPSGTKVFDWTVPKEWKIREGWIADINGNKLIDLATNNLHIMGYSISVDKIVSRSELEPYLYSLPEQPNAIPYITSYYKENFGFCLSQDQRDSLGDGPFHIFIDSQLFDGSLTYAELLIPGDTKEEILFSTYVCHPSMANNELSGPVVSIALAKHIQSLESRRFSYRFLFTVETIGSILYISKHLKRMKENLVCGWVLTCMGDERTYSYVPTRNGETLTDFISKRVLKDLGATFLEYSWLDRGSDERQFNSPGVDLPFASLMRTRYGDYPEYHTSLDNLEVISPEGLSGGLEMLKSAVKILETNAYWKVNVLCEPQLGKRGLYPNVSTKTSGIEIRNQMNVISYFDGSTDLLQIADKCKISYNEVLEVLEKLKNSGLIDKVGIRKSN